VRAGRRIGKSTVDRVAARVHQLRLLDDHLGGTSTYDVVTGELAATAAMLRAASYTDSVGRRLLVAIGELCGLGSVGLGTSRRGGATVPGRCTGGARRPRCRRSCQQPVLAFLPGGQRR
jgi:hypothetical protein